MLRLILEFLRQMSWLKVNLQKTELVIILMQQDSELAKKN
jgi:hypothetical protein